MAPTYSFLMLYVLHSFFHHLRCTWCWAMRILWGRSAVCPALPPS